MNPHFKEVSDPALMHVAPVVSVAMLAYNHSAFIAEAIEGVVIQNAAFPIELVIGADQSPDNTQEIVLRYQRMHPQLIRVLVPEQRLGANQNSLITLGACRGKYTALCEGDDFWTDPNKLAKQIEFLQSNPTAAGSFHDCYVLQQSSGKKGLRIGERKIDRDPDVASVIRENNIPACSMVYRNVIPAAQREAWLSRTAKGDYMLALLVAQYGTWHYLDEPMSVYRVHAGGIWSGIREVERYNHNIQFWKMLENSIDFAQVADVSKARRRNEFRGLSIALARAGKLWESSGCYLRSLGTKKPLKGHHIGSLKYFKVFGRCLADRFGMEEMAGRLWRKITGRKINSF